MERSRCGGLWDAALSGGAVDGVHISIYFQTRSVGSATLETTGARHGMGHGLVELCRVMSTEYDERGELWK